MTTDQTNNEEQVAEEMAQEVRKSMAEQPLNTEKNKGRIDFIDHGDGYGVDCIVSINNNSLDSDEGKEQLDEMMAKGRPSPAVAATLQTLHLMTTMLNGVQDGPSPRRDA